MGHPSLSNDLSRLVLRERSTNVPLNNNSPRITSVSPSPPLGGSTGIRRLNVADQSPSSSSSPVIRLQEPQAFLLFVKICMLYFQGRDYRDLKQRVKTLVAKATAENRRGNPAYTPLCTILRAQIYKVLGDVHWRNIQAMMDSYCESRRIQVMMWELTFIQHCHRPLVRDSLAIRCILLFRWNPRSQPWNHLFLIFYKAYTVLRPFILLYIFPWSKS